MLIIDSFLSNSSRNSSDEILQGKKFCLQFFLPRALVHCLCFSVFLQERPRPTFAALAPAVERNPVTGLLEPHFPEEKRFPRIVSGIAIVICMVSIAFDTLSSKQNKSNLVIVNFLRQPFTARYKYEEGFFYGGRISIFLNKPDKNANLVLVLTITIIK